MNRGDREPSLSDVFETRLAEILTEAGLKPRARPEPNPQERRRKRETAEQVMREHEAWHRKSPFQKRLYYLGGFLVYVAVLALIVVINIHPIAYLVAIVGGGVHISWRAYKRRAERHYRI